MPQNGAPSSSAQADAAAGSDGGTARGKVSPVTPRRALTGRAILAFALGILVTLAVCQMSGLSERLAPLPLPSATVAPTSTHTPEPTFTPTHTLEPTPVPTETATPVPVVAAGGSAEVSGAGVEELRMRAGAGLAYETLGTLGDGTHLTVLAGPESADGYEWWQVSTDDGREGWVAGEWLAPVVP